MPFKKGITLNDSSNGTVGKKVPGDSTDQLHNRRTQACDGMNTMQRKGSQSTHEKCNHKHYVPPDNVGVRKLANQKTEIILNSLHHHQTLPMNNRAADASLHMDVQIAQYIMTTGKINAVGARIPLNSNWNMRLFRSLCTSDSDQEVATYLQFGWPLNRENGPVERTYGNHMMANKFPQQIWKYLQKEKRMGTILGPFATSPFHQTVTGISPMLTRSKKLLET